MNCPHCYGIGYDASGQRCTCNDMPIQFVDVPKWRIALGRIAKLALYLIAIAVIAGPAALMIFFSKPDSKPEIKCVPTRRMT